MAEVRHITFSQYKSIAHNVLRQHAMLETKILPVNIELLLDKMNITVRPISGLYRDFGVNGALIKKIGGYDIVIDEEHYEKKEFYYRFTLAEELAHFLVHTELLGGAQTLEDIQAFHRSLDDEQYKRMENQARNIANQLLLPSCLLDPLVLRWAKEHRDELMSLDTNDKGDIAKEVAQRLHRGLKLSFDVVYWSILRYPDPLAERILLMLNE